MYCQAPTDILSRRNPQKKTTLIDDAAVTIPQLVAPPKNGGWAHSVVRFMPLIAALGEGLALAWRTIGGKNLDILLSPILDF